MYILLSVEISHALDIYSRFAMIPRVSAVELLPFPLLHILTGTGLN
jgi:hypothetical protein